jgi:hypothetical protein
MGWTSTTHPSGCATSSPSATYERAGPGHYAWTNPHGLTYESNPLPKQ